MLYYALKPDINEFFVFYIVFFFFNGEEIIYQINRNESTAMEKNFQLFDLVRTGLWCLSYLMSQYSILSFRHLIYTCGSMAKTYSGCRAIALRDIGEGKCNSIASLNVATNLVFINKNLNIIRVLC